MSPKVVLLHGLGRTHRSLSGLRRAIETEGYDTWAKTYPSRARTVPELTHELADSIRADIGTADAIAVTHSLGGVLARFMYELVPWQRIVMLAPPNQGSRVSKALSHHSLFRWFFGPAGQMLAEPRDWPIPRCPIGIIAGTAGATIGNIPSWAIRGLGIMPPAEAHDGTVTVSETHLAPMVAYAEVPASHTFIMNHPTTQALVLEFLESGTFGDSINPSDGSNGDPRR